MGIDGQGAHPIGSPARSSPLQSKPRAAIKLIKVVGRRGFHFRPNTRPAGDSQRYVDLFERPAERRVISQGSSSRHPTRSLAARLEDAALKLNNSTHQLIDPLDSKPLQARSPVQPEISSTHLHTISNRFTTPFIAPLIPAIPLWVLLEP
ncbi:hypothetical protein PGT21_036398 [Puccinia graminis f. sp. tritici]|uniref:Uncharacterized protein n=1 Tax=Puccinia graminis f. sp. tritici TaxID=56615 RepID=A0A5B0NRR8_PUCGR|nr:hypothetical protein PGT21_036398 [Puccinia graminis f. sp. tritici]